MARSRFAIVGRLIATAFFAIVAVEGAVAKKQPPLDPGPRPTMQEYISIVEPAIRQTLLDPDAAKIRFPVGLLQGEKGWFTCVAIIGKNAYGGYTGERFASVGVVNGSVSFVLMPETTQGMFIDSQCRQMIAQGKFPPPE